MEEDDDDDDNDDDDDHYAFPSILTSPNVPHVQFSSAAPLCQTPSGCITTVIRQTKFHTQTNTRHHIRLPRIKIKV